MSFELWNTALCGLARLTALAAIKVAKKKCRLCLWPDVFHLLVKTHVDFSHSDGGKVRKIAPGKECEKGYENNQRGNSAFSFFQPLSFFQD